MKDKSKMLKIIPVGGCYEIGMNLMILETDQDIILIDSGLGFSDHNFFGIDILIADYSYLEKNKDKIRALIITHGHEDHIGAVTYLLNLKNVPVYTARFPAELIANKCTEEEIDADLIIIGHFQEYIIGDFKIVFFPMDHSIPETSGLKILVYDYRLVYISDFKIGGGKKQFLRLVKEVGLKNCDLLFSDSTNVMVSGWSEEEDVLKPYIADIVNNSKGKVFFTTFASNVKRIQTAIDIAKRANRKVFLMGRSMLEYSSIARDLGYLKYEKSDLVPIERIGRFDNQNIFIIATGSQGENRSIMKRLSLSEMKRVKMNEGDTVMFSSKIIPGNERDLRVVINDMSRLKVNIFTEENSKIHVTGHAKRDELLFVLESIRPRNFVPVHGEYRFLYEHARLAEKSSTVSQNCVVLENGQTAYLSSSGLRKDEFIIFRPISLDFINRQVVAENVLIERKKIAKIGIIFIILHIDKKAKVLKDDPRIISKAFSSGGLGVCFFSELLENIRALIREYLQNNSKLIEENINETVEVFTKRYINKELGFRPIVVVESFFR